MLDRRQTVEMAPMKVGGLWGERLQATLDKWLLQVDDHVLLDCFRRRPGAQAFVGEHVGKYVDCALLDNYILDSQKLRDKVEGILRELLTCQEEDGYLGTYLPETRYLRDPNVENCGWDPWVFKYILIALWRYCQARKDPDMIACGLKMLALLNRVYGEGGQYNLNCSDEHAGLASGSILEAVVLWYEMTGEPFVRDFADRIVKYYWSEEAPYTPHLLKNMTEHPYGLKTVGRGKAYEMMSCFVGLVEYARVTGQRAYLDKVIAARDGIAQTQRSINGCMSEREWFPRDNNGTELADLENCVAFTWIQLNARIFQMTGDPKAMEYVEETALNHIMEAVCPDGSTWIYYTTLYGPKDYTYWSQLPSSPLFRQQMNILGCDHEYSQEQLEAVYEQSAPITCCHTNGQRALGLVPQYAFTASDQGELYVNLMMEAQKEMHIGGQALSVCLHTDFPRSGRGELQVKAQAPLDALIRVPAWAQPALVEGRDCKPGEYARVHLQAGDNRVALDFGMGLRLLSPGHSNRGKFSVAYGPLLMAVDTLPQGWDFEQVALALSAKEPVSALALSWENGWPLVKAGAYRIDNRIGASNWHDLPHSLEKAQVLLRPFLFAGLGDNLEASQRFEDHLPYDTALPLYTYRVMFPCFFV